jgi:CRISPR-associated endonuclease Cas1
MHAQTSVPRNGILAVHGYGIKIHVYRRHLIIEDGIGQDRRTRRYHRTAKLRRLVLVGRTGYITLEAIRWLHDTGAALVHIDADGQLLTTSTLRSRNLPGLRRAQALAPGSPAGLQTARELLYAKVAGQASLLRDLPGGEEARSEVARALADIERADQLGDILEAEARAAAAYWAAWSNVMVPIAALSRQQAHSIPEHWRTFAQRHSILTASTRTAVNPANAILNYLYALLEAETTLACQQIGMDPGLGIFHTDQRDRDSLALDIMEAARPAVDAYVLGLLEKRTLSADDFAETRQGACRLTQTAASRLAETTTAWRGQITPHVERVAHILAGSNPSRAAAATPLTRANSIRAQRERGTNPRQRRRAVPSLPDTCRDCGTQLADPRHRYCPTCREQRWERNAHRGRQNAAQVLAGLRAEQRDPGHGGQAAKSRGSKNAAHQAAVKAWDGDRLDPGVFTDEILPGLQRVAIAELVAATGLSEHYSSLIRLGKRVPHPRHWESLANLQTVARRP